MYHPKGSENLVPGSLSSLAMVAVMAFGVSLAIPDARKQIKRFVRQCQSALTEQHKAATSAVTADPATSSVLFLPSPEQSPPAPLPPAPALDMGH